MAATATALATRGRLSLIAIAAAPTLFFPETSLGCSCSGGGTVISWVLPRASETAPVNTHIWVMVEFPPGLARRLALPEPRKVEVEVRGPDGAEVSCRRRNIRSGDVLTVELVPEQPLRAETTYQVSVAGPTDPHIHRITTGRDWSTSPPTWDWTIPGARYLHPTARGGGDCNTGEPLIMMENGQLPPGFRNDPPRYAIWTGRKSGDIRFDRAPDFYVDARLVLGSLNICSARNFVFEPGPLRLGIRRVDVAGNYSSRAVEVQFDEIPPTCNASGIWEKGAPEPRDPAALEGRITESGNKPAAPANH